MDSILLGVPLGLASVTISLPLNPPRIFFKDSKDKSTNEIIRDLPFLATAAEVLRLEARVVPLTVQEGAIMRRAEEALALLMILTLRE